MVGGFMLDIKPGGGEVINRQQHKRSCGLTAIANAYQWLGGKMGYKNSLGFGEVEKISAKGLWPYEMVNGLEKLGIDHEVRFSLTQRDIDKIVKAGDAIIYLYSWKRKDKKGKLKRGAHYVFIDAVKDKKIRAWNWSRKGKTPWMSRKHLSKYVNGTNRHRPELYAIAFVIKGWT